MRRLWDFKHRESQYFTLQTTLSDPELEQARKIVASEIESDKHLFQNNHPGLNSTQFFEVLEGAKVFIGLGFPFEGPSPIEALQAGCYFINPIWEPPIGRSLDGPNSKEYIRGFFSGKPTLRKLESQVPYLATINRNGITGIFESLWIWQTVRSSLKSTDKIITTKIDDLEHNADLIEKLERIKTETQFERVVLNEFTPNGLQRRIHGLFQKSFCWTYNLYFLMILPKWIKCCIFIWVLKWGVYRNILVRDFWTLATWVTVVHNKYHFIEDH